MIFRRQESGRVELMIGVVVFLRLLVTDLGGAERVLDVGERLRLIEIGLDTRENVAAVNVVAVAMKDGDDFAGDGRLDVDFHFRLHGADFGDFHLNVGDFSLADFHRRLRFPLVRSFRLHRHENGDDDDGENDREDRDFPFFSRCHMASQWLLEAVFECAPK